MAPNDIAGSGNAPRGFGSLNENHLGRIRLDRPLGAENRCCMDGQELPI
jgi:hypothetical protein